jgi:UDP-GlcNAc:undecaprenyl-phosphate/decaprenyl-phosphate GlcNAc-1-phosphate transferase
MNLNLFQYLVILFVMSTFAFFITPFFRKLARSAKIFDYPGGRKHQALPVAYLGGLAIVTPITFGSILVIFTSLSGELKIQFFLGLILPSLAIAFIGLLDDIYQLPPWPRFIGQSGVGIITSFMLHLSGGGIKFFENSLLNSLVTSLWVVTTINALNFMDNMDGLATSLTIVISTSFFMLSFINGQYLVAALCMAILGACIGFFFWNKKPASIYLGDAGALYLGFLLAAISIRVDVNSQSEIVRIIVPLLILAVPIIDITQVVTNRIIKGKSPFQGGRDHLSHLLLNKGLSEGNVLIVLTTVAILFAVFGVFLAVRN